MLVVALVLGIALGALAAWLVMRERLASATRGRTEVVREFQALATAALRESKSDFLELARTQLEGLNAKASADLEQKRQAVEHLVKPIAERLERFDGKIHELERARTEAYGSLLAQVRGLNETQRELREQTGNLVTALRAPAVRGRWGEMQLRRVVEAAGMVAYCDFAEQSTIGGADGVGRPDLIVHLAGGKNVVVDAKAPIEAYLDALEEKDETLRAGKLRDHARQVRDHVLKLSAKSYWSKLESSPEFVVLFIPGETFFGAALEHDPSLIEEATKRQVILATPTTLIAVLWAIAHGWREERLAQNAREISELGRDLHGRLGTLAEHFGKLRRSIESVVRSYNDAAGSLESRVLVSARRLKDLGTTATGEIDVLESVETVPRQLNAPELAEPRALDDAA
jgi:DNA recombination protein RmuC